MFERVSGWSNFESAMKNPCKRHRPLQLKKRSKSVIATPSHVGPKFGRTRTGFGRSRAKFDRARGQLWATFGRARAKLGPSRVMSGRFWPPMLASSGHILCVRIFGPSWANLGRSRAESGRIWSNSAQKRSKTAQRRSIPAHMWSIRGQVTRDLRGVRAHLGARKASTRGLPGSRCAAVKHPHPACLDSLENVRQPLNRNAPAPRRERMLEKCLPDCSPQNGPQERSWDKSSNHSQTLLPG